MLSFNSDREFFSWLISNDFREGQYSEGELLYMLKRFKEEYRKVEGTKRGLENDITNLNKRAETDESEIKDLKKQIEFLNIKNQVLLKKFSKGLTLFERLSGRVKYNRDQDYSNIE